MTRKHFKALADVLKAARSEIDGPTFSRLVHDIANICSEANPRFDRAKFIAACRSMA